MEPDATPPDFLLWGFVKDQVYRTPVYDLADLQERIYAAIKKVTYRCFITHGSRLNSGWIFSMPLMDSILRFMEQKIKSKFSLFVSIDFIFRFVLVQKLELFLSLYLSGTWCIYFSEYAAKSSFSITLILRTWSETNMKWVSYQGYSQSKEHLGIQSAHLFCCSRSLVSGFQCDVEKLPHAVMYRALSRGKCRDSCGHECADWKSRWLWGARCYYWLVFWRSVEILGYLAEEASSHVELFSCTTMHVRKLPGRHKPLCMSNSIGTSSSILHTVGTWDRRTFPCFHKWKNTLLVNVSQMMTTWRTLVEWPGCHLV